MDLNEYKTTNYKSMEPTSNITLLPNAHTGVKNI